MIICVFELKLVHFIIYLSIELDLELTLFCKFDFD